jgi:hypothetical protein
MPLNHPEFDEESDMKEQWQMAFGQLTCGIYVLTTMDYDGMYVGKS